MTRPTRTTSATAPDLMTSASSAEMLAAELEEHAARVEHEAAENGNSRIVQARVRVLRRHVRQIEAVHADEES